MAEKLALIEQMNKRGVLVHFDAVVITCAKTGEILGYEFYDDPSPAFAELNTDSGGVQFSVIDPKAIDPKKLN